MRVSIKVVMDVDAERWAANTNGPWPEDDKRSLNTAVRLDIREQVMHTLSSVTLFEELGIEVEVK